MYEGFNESYEHSKKMNKAGKESAKYRATSRVESGIAEFKRIYSDRGALIQKKKEGPFDIEFGYLPFDAREEYDHYDVVKKSSTNYYTSYSATISSSGSVSIDPHTDEITSTYYGTETTTSAETQSTQFKLVKKGCGNIVKQKEAAFVRSYSGLAQAFNAIDHKTKTVKSGYEKASNFFSKLHGIHIAFSAIINLIFSIYLILFAILNASSMYEFIDGGIDGLIPAKQLFIVNIITIVLLLAFIIKITKGPYLSVYKAYSYCTLNDSLHPAINQFDDSTGDYYRTYRLYLLISLIIPVLTIIKDMLYDTLSELSVFYQVLIIVPFGWLGVIGGFALVLASVIAALWSLVHLFKGPISVKRLKNYNSGSMSPKALLASPVYKKMYDEFSEIISYNIINLDSEEWFNDYEKVMMGKMTVKQFASLHPEFIIGFDPIDPDDPLSDYTD